MNARATATRKEIAYGLVIIWALIGIISKRTNTNIITTAEASAVIILIAIAATAILTKLKNNKKTSAHTAIRSHCTYFGFGGLILTSNIVVRLIINTI
jgi:hypothetical protein